MELIPMKIIKTDLPQLKCAYPIATILPLDSTIFLDIETTGFSPKTSNLYLIGCVYYKDNIFKLIQWFAAGYEDEIAILNEFFSFIKYYKHMVHFNGNNFDIPYLIQKAAQYGLPDNFDSFEALDLYKRIIPYKQFLKLPNCKQKTVETFLNVNREDVFHGGELISVYHEYCKMPSDIGLQTLVLHNADDIQGLVALMPFLSYCDLFNQDPKVTKVQANYYKDINGNKKQEILMKLHFQTALPVAISQGISGCYFTGFGYYGSLKVPIIEEELKYFYSNYKDYYYLPEEDCAMHKSVAKFVDKNHRTNATASTCYTRKKSAYLPQWEILFEPFFKREYISKDIFFELTDEFKKERTSFAKYAGHILQMMVKYS